MYILRKEDTNTSGTDSQTKEISKRCPDLSCEKMNVIFVLGSNAKLTIPKIKIAQHIPEV